MSSRTIELKNLTIAYIGGGSKGWAWGLMSDLALEGELAGTVRLYDLNREAAGNNAVIGNRLKERDDVRGKWSYEAVDTLEQALTGADFVIISILPGTFDEMEADVHLPEAYGVYQSVGDTVGPGGTVRAMRTIPMFAVFAEAIRNCAPEAWVINYTNPMTLCMRTLYEVFPTIKAFGCCHEVFGTQHLLARMLEKETGRSGINRRDIHVNVLGINHFTWIDKASYAGMDLIPSYSSFVESHHAEGFEGTEKGHWMNNHFASAECVKFDLFRRYGVIAAAGDRHLAEFMPHSWYLTSPETVRKWKFSLTPVAWRKQHQKELQQKSSRLASGEEGFTIKPTGEEGIDMIKALLGLGELITNVNLPNRGQMTGMPIGAVVETNAVFRHDSVQPVFAGQLPAPVHSLVMRHVLNQEALLQAALKQDTKAAFRAFVQDPLIGHLAPDEASALFLQMLERTKAYLPGWDISL